MSTSINQNAFRLPYQVSSGTDSMIGRRGCIDLSINAHIASPSEMCVSASITVCMAYLLAKRCSRPVEPDGSCGTDNDLQFLLVYNRCPESWRDERIESTHGPARTVDVFLDGSNPLQHQMEPR